MELTGEGAPYSFFSFTEPRKEFAAFGSARLARVGRCSSPFIRFWSHGDQKRRRFAMKSPCGRWHASAYRKQSVLALRAMARLSVQKTVRAKQRVFGTGQ